MKLSRKTKPHTYQSLVNTGNDQLIGGLIVHLQAPVSLRHCQCGIYISSNHFKI